MTVDVLVKAWDVVTGKETYSKIIKSGLLLPKTQSTEIADFEVPVKVKDAGEEGRIVVAAYLIEDGKQVARYINWPEPLKYLHLQKPKHLATEVSRDGRTVEISAEVPVKGVALECEDDDVVFDDNCVDIVPGEVVSISMKGGNKATIITTRYLGMI